MKLRELIERLEELHDSLGDDVDPEVVAAYQESYPLSGAILGATSLEEDERAEMQGQSVVWIAIGSHPPNLSPYAPRAAFEDAS